VSHSTLKHERDFVGSAAESRAQFDDLIRLARSRMTVEAGTGLADPVIRQRLAALEGRVEAHFCMGQHQATLAEEGRDAGALPMLNKLTGTLLMQEVWAIAADLLEEDAGVTPARERPGPRDTAQWAELGMRSLSRAIAGGTSKVPREIGELVPHGLKGADGPTELATDLYVVAGHFEGLAGGSERISRAQDAQGVPDLVGMSGRQDGRAGRRRDPENGTCAVGPLFRLGDRRSRRIKGEAGRGLPRDMRDKRVTVNETRRLIAGSMEEGLSALREIVGQTGDRGIGGPGAVKEPGAQGAVQGGPRRQTAAGGFRCKGEGQQPGGDFAILVVRAERRPGPEIEETPVERLRLARLDVFQATLEGVGEGGLRVG
jgi:hypothetical protein